MKRKCIICGKENYYGLTCNECHYSGMDDLAMKIVRDAREKNKYNKNWKGITDAQVRRKIKELLRK